MTTPPIPQMTRYRQWLREQRGLNFGDYEGLRQWSVRELDAFWQSIWDYFELRSPTPHRAVLAQRKMPGAVWFPGAEVNYARQVLRHVEAAHAAGMPAIGSPPIYPTSPKPSLPFSPPPASARCGASVRLTWPRLR